MINARMAITLLCGSVLPVLAAPAEANPRIDKCYAELAAKGIGRSVLEEPLHYNVEYASTLGAYLCDFVRSGSFYGVRQRWFSSQVDVAVGPFQVRFDKVKATATIYGGAYEPLDSPSASLTKYAVVAVRSDEGEVEVTRLDQNLSVLLSLHAFASPYPAE